MFPPGRATWNWARSDLGSSSQWAGRGEPPTTRRAIFSAPAPICSFERKLDFPSDLTQSAPPLTSCVTLQGILTY